MAQINLPDNNLYRLTNEKHYYSLASEYSGFNNYISLSIVFSEDTF